MVGQMLAYNPIYSYSADPADHLLAMERERDALWYADVQVGGHYPAYRLREMERAGIKLEMGENDLELSQPIRQISCRSRATEARRYRCARRSSRSRPAISLSAW